MFRKSVPHLRLLSKFSDKQLRNCSLKFFHYSNNGGEYHFLNKFNYVGNHGIYWKHPESPFVIRITDDFEKCEEGNRTDVDTCWLHFSKNVLNDLSKDFNETQLIDVINELRNWKPIQNLPKRKFEWVVNLPRVYCTFPKVPYEQKVFCAKHLMSTFLVDDEMEKLFALPESNTACVEFITNLRNIFYDRFDDITDMNKFKCRDNISDATIEGAIRAMNIHIELGHSAKQLLKPKIYDFYQTLGHTYLDGVEKERKLFQQHLPQKRIISEQEGRACRFYTVGFFWILADTLTDEKYIFHLNTLNPLTYLATYVILLENDLCGAFKDRTIEFSPMTFYHTDNWEMSEVTKAKIIVNKINTAKKAFEDIYQLMPREHLEYYVHLEKLMTMLLDYNFVSGCRKGNTRYGWVPTLD
ncbi:hypothetical protein Bhyg_13550 [Pseudolycoriella hygida]|uniref:Terpene synthase n=1 Tax=Pseudolycoriella hygida TaxID=35572 RepID=A0A9Q0MN21_9DIPT|nr:hypothetical protein Bhyg_13550 [Pseudolycoriella hygida]